MPCSYAHRSTFVTHGRPGSQVRRAPPPRGYNPRVLPHGRVDRGHAVHCHMTSAIDRRRFLLALPALAAAPRLFAQTPAAAPFRPNGLSSITLTVADVKRSLDFYQGLFGMPVQARQGSSVLLRIGSGPRFLALRQAAAGEAPSISALGFGVERFSVDSAMKALAAHGITAAPPTAVKPGPKQALVRVRRQNEGGSPDGSTR